MLFARQRYPPSENTRVYKKWSKSMKRHSDYNNFTNSDDKEEVKIYEIEIECRQRALTLARGRKKEEQIWKANTELGDVYFMNNRFYQAMECYTTALEIAKDTNDRRRETLAYLKLGNAYRLDSQNETAIQHYRKAMEISVQRGEQYLKDFARNAIEELSLITGELC